MTSILPILTLDNLGQFDRFFAKYMQNLFDGKHHLRLRRVGAGFKKLELWLSQEREK